MDLQNNYKYQLLLKEIDIIQSTIKNLDDIIYKTKNFAFLFWGGSLYLIVKLENFSPDTIQHLIWFTGFIPIMFWAVDYYWRKHLRLASSRERIISLFINSDQFEKWLNQTDNSIKFPVFDPVGWIYLNKKKNTELVWDSVIPNRKKIDKKHLENFDTDYLTTEFSFLGILLYKDAKVYYFIMIAISVLFGYFYSPQ